LLFARNESTRFISPTKTPEYLAAGKPVISTSIRDVVRPYGELNLVEITDTADEFIAAAEKLLSRPDHAEWLQKVDAYLKNISWDKTWAQMSDLIDEVIERKQPARALPLNGLSQRAGAAAITR
jgi:UDP-galactopyranose mutase